MNVYVVLVCEHPYDLAIFVSGWYLLHVHVLVDFLDFVIVLFQSGVFEHVLFYGGWGACCVYLQNAFVYAEKTVSGGKERVAREISEFQRSPSRRLSSMVKCIFISEDKRAITNLDKYGI